jgi:hypothetical protein
VTKLLSKALECRWAIFVVQSEASGHHTQDRLSVLTAAQGQKLSSELRSEATPSALFWQHAELRLPCSAID